MYPENDIERMFPVIPAAAAPPNSDDWEPKVVGENDHGDHEDELQGGDFGKKVGTKGFGARKGSPPASGRRK